MKKIISIQHCESIHHTNGMIGSWTDWELNENGIKQAHNIGEKLGKELQNDFMIYTSDLKRAYQTAEIIGKYLNQNPVKVKALRELNLGSACGKTTKWFKDNASMNNYSVDHKYLDDSESIREHYNRIKPFIDDVINNEHEYIILVSHGGTAGIIHTIFMNQTIETLNTLRINSEAGTISKYSIHNDIRRISTIGDSSYKK